MAGKATAAALLLSIVVILCLSEVNSQIPKEVVTAVDDFFGCSKFKGHGTCNYRLPDQRDRLSNECPGGADKWDYKHLITGTCYCFKCK
jgi:hypothetical protein